MQSSKDKNNEGTYYRLSDTVTQYNTEAKSLFLIKKKTFSQQFSNLYFLRLKQMKPKLLQRAQKKYPDATVVDRVLELKYDEDDPEKKYIVVGTLFKDMKLKPNILQEYTRERSEMSAIQQQQQQQQEEELNCPTGGSRVSPDDKLILEDTSGRVALVLHHGNQTGNNASSTSNSNNNHHTTIGSLVTGIIAALYGHVDQSGHLHIGDIIFSDLPPQSIPPTIANSDKDIYVAFVSGICIGHPRFNLLNTQNMFDYLSGCLGEDSEQCDLISKIVRVVLVGNSVWQDDTKSHQLFDVRGSLRPIERASLVEPMRAVDQLVEQLSQSVHVDIMPGEYDPSNTSLPQQPLHPSMLPKSSQLSTCHLVTNPYSFTILGTDFLGTSGQSINDLKLYSTETNSIQLMEQTLKWGHMAPTAPDTLNCYPFFDMDPFIITYAPHVYFCGNQEQLDTKLIVQGEKRIRLIALPSFVTSGLIVLVNVRNLDVHPILFHSAAAAAEAEADTWSLE
jgi:DNA polymerase delta subunit 2